MLSGYHPVVNMERGIFGLGNQAVDAMAVDWVLNGMGGTTDDRIVVHGGSENSLAVLGYLLNQGVTSDRIVWVSPVQHNVIDLGHADVSILPCSVEVIH